jgi:hypothetical protein
MTIVNTEDKRNTEWRDNNIGSKLLNKMGWKEGSGIGLRNKNVTALRAVKRQVGLGIGAKRQSEGGPSESTGTFAAVLANLKSHHGNDDDNDKKKKSKKDKKKSKKSSKKSGSGLMLPQNKVLAGHSRKMREAKFGIKSQHDLACIFGNTDVVETAAGSFTPISAIQAKVPSASSKKKRSRDDDDDDNEDGGDSPSSSDADDNEELTKKKEEKEQKRAAKKQRKEEKKKQKSISSSSDDKKKKKKSSKKI